MGRFFGYFGVFLLILVGVTLRFPNLFNELKTAAEIGRMELDEGGLQRFRADALKKINDLRKPISLSPMLIDTDLQTALSSYVRESESPAEIDLQQLFSHIQSQFPGAQFLSANVCHSLTDRGLIDALTVWGDIASPEYESISMALFENGHRVGCIAVLAKRLPEFSVSSANNIGGRYFNRCPHCSKTHAVELNKKSRTLVLACPDCTEPYDVLAADTEGKFYRANDFLLGFKLPKVVGRTNQEARAPSEETLLHIWRTIVNHCEYENDSSRSSQREAWKTPDQTWLERSGDCEDTSILLADSLISAGIKARVAIGWNKTIGQHAWCIAMIGDKQYLLESTIQNGRDVRLITTTEAASEYRAEQLFDRQFLYFRKVPATQSLTDHWSGRNWKAVTRKKPAPAITQIQEIEAPLKN